MTLNTFYMNQCVTVTIRTDCDPKVVVETLKTVFSGKVDGIDEYEVEVTDWNDGEYTVCRDNTVVGVYDREYRCIDDMSGVMELGDVECMLDSLGFEYTVIGVDVPDEDEICEF